MTAAIFGLIGVVVGSVLTAGLNYLLQKRADERRWEWEDRLRFQADRLRLYRDFIAEAERVSMGVPPTVGERMWVLLSEIQLLGSTEALHAATDVSSKAVPYEEVAREGFSEENKDAIFEAQSVLQESIRQFANVSRQHLDLQRPGRP